MHNYVDHQVAGTRSSHPWLLIEKLSIHIIITMFIAAFVIHFGDPLKDKEMALLYLAAYMAIGAYGAGRFSLDDKLLNK